MGKGTGSLGELAPPKNGGAVFRTALVAASVLLATCAWAAPRLYVGNGGWAAVTGAEAAPEGAGWFRIGDGTWAGRIADGAETVSVGDTVLPLADALPLPAGAAALPAHNNPFGDCIVRSLGVRFDQAVKGRSWSLIGSPAGKAGEFARLKDAKGGDLKLVFTLEDAQSGARWRLVPERMAQEGGVYSWFRGSARAYAGTLDGGKIDWLIATEKMSDGKWIVQGRVLLMEKETRFFRLRAGVADAAGAVPVAGWNGGTEQAPGVAAVRVNGAAVALLADLSEPRRMRAVRDGEEDGMALEFDLAATPATANFPRRATFSVTLETWKSGSVPRRASSSSPSGAPVGTDLRQANQTGSFPPADSGGGFVEEEAAARWVRPEGGGEAVPLGGLPFCPARVVWKCGGGGGGFSSPDDAWECLEVLASGLAPEGGKGYAAALSCAARDEAGRPLVRVQDNGEAIGVLNIDPDLRTLFAMGMNRGLWARERCLAGLGPGGWVCVEVAEGGLDCQARALEMCDYPAVWPDGSWRPAVDTVHAQSEWLLAMGCAVREAGGRLCVRDDGPYAPFTTYAADALLCAAVSPEALRRTRNLAGGRPCVWSAALARQCGAGAEELRRAERLARELGFAIDGE
jgi:hypothetical protein